MTSTPALSMFHDTAQTRSSRIQPWIVIFSASLFFFFEFMQVNMFNALNPSLFKAFHLTNATQLGQLSAGYMYANVLFLFPAGMILDRFPTRKIILLAMSFCVLCALLFSFTTALWQAEICRLITGIGGSFCLLSCVRLASRWFPPKHMALVVGLIVTFAMVGGMTAQTPFTKSVELLGWRNTLRIDAAIGFCMLIIIALFVRDFPPGTQTLFDKAHASLEKIGFWHALTRVTANLQNWLAGAYTSLINLPIFLLGSTWGSWYLMQTKHQTADSASWITMMIFVGMIIGSPVIGEISDLIERRKLPMILGAIASFAVIIAIMYLPHLSFGSLMFLFFLLGFVISSQVIGYPLVAESNPAILTGTAEGLASMLIMGGGLAIPLFPALLNLHWNHVIQNGIPLYTTENYHLAFMIMPIAFVIALGIAFVIKDTRCHALEESSTTAL
ncbi:MAG: MFS transporter [Gammaproteobacteria bacterium RIFCSPLOWO2_02_FULL_42_14]|nr:MAG: MFS transporter [Gammaproteobacteria bacterium RIFCSPHIGHO2_02_FULL_42_43]OGT51596.1 MAG: MFS transporter [Gammaproteobacteria bacterium RIFCSPHIGHO2_12_FULL_41_25]OGT62295.1 MAG: MFS transporter [Gammaproteobacteria bacterium RIFCSPLOWO2_02_FULL_42_14]OGT85969.1 MAG: MFS transporter [Gammaproteobacteria bacterium RIFCSPLOWO2_12_FULL_42_18]